MRKCSYLVEEVINFERCEITHYYLITDMWTPEPGKRVRKFVNKIFLLNHVFLGKMDMDIDIIVFVLRSVISFCAIDMIR